MTDYVGYIRVSTAEQGRSGLGLEAQEEAIRRFMGAGDRLLVPLYREMESGKRNDRPELAKALAHARLTGAKLLVAKLDRLARNVAFVSQLMDAGVEFTACDMPDASRMTIHIIAAVDENERKRISDRTKAALAAAKARGVILGGWRANGVKVDPSLGLEARQRAAGQFNDRVRVAVEDVKAEGIVSLGGIARRLNERGVQTRRGGEWTATQVARVLA
ncbi:resolvase [Sphingomonas paeninsulae]|uniref:Resolvase n=1 Tax=Sphingomonas paeninsulae TaxID=2319844 RepID=A0A494TLJ3_SPHPE|nr:recombinase family protein [Sphingomonas paeninsulae]AYJ86696.1 resolvase [Sphingomonas paeninsulae]